MGVIENLIADQPLPKMARVRQRLGDETIADPAKAVREELRRPEIRALVSEGMSIALGVGSRGLAELPVLVRAAVDGLKEIGAKPYIVPAMGSHGAASAEGQRKLLQGLGVTEESAGCEIRSSMETVELGSLPNGLPVLMDAEAMKADGIVVLNRVKPHTSFTGEIESGLAKMITIGLGNQRGAESCHAQGFGSMAENVIAMARHKLDHTPILFGIASLENALDKIRKIEAVPAARLLERERELLAEARENMPRILFNPLDVLIVDWMGKEFSGTGMDPHVTGRASTPYLKAAQQVSKMVILDLTDKSSGNANGMGLADICTRRLYDKIDLEPTYANAVTSTVMTGVKIPLITGNDRDAARLALRTSNAADLAAPRMARIPNTLQLGEIEISEALLAEAEANPMIEILTEARPWEFDADGNLKRS